MFTLPKLPLGDGLYARLYGRGPYYVAVFDAATDARLAGLPTITCGGYDDPSAPAIIRAAYTAQLPEKARV